MNLTFRSQCVVIFHLACMVLAGSAPDALMFPGNDFTPVQRVSNLPDHSSR